MDRIAVLAAEDENKRARLAAEILESDEYTSTAARAAAFVQQGGGCRATFFNWRRGGHVRPFVQTCFIDMLKTPRSWYDRPMEPTVTQDQPEPHGKPMTLPVITEYIGVRPGYCGGEAHILGHRITDRCAK